MEDHRSCLIVAIFGWNKMMSGSLSDTPPHFFYFHHQFLSQKQLISRTEWKKIKTRFIRLRLVFTNTTGGKKCGLPFLGLWPWNSFSVPWGLHTWEYFLLLYKSKLIGCIFLRKRERAATFTLWDVCLPQDLSPNGGMGSFYYGAD